MTHPQQTGETGRIDLGAGWSFKRQGQWLVLTMPDGITGPAYWGEEDARAFAAAMQANSPVPPLDREKIARALYEDARKRVSGRPAWEVLNSHDKYEQGMRDFALQQADAAIATLPPAAMPSDRPAQGVAALLREVLDCGLIYWEPQTSRGVAAKADMIARCEALLARPDTRQDAGGTGDHANSWEANVRFLLNNCPIAVRVREGGGLEDLKSSLAVTFAKLQRLIPTPPAQDAQS